MPWRIVLAHPLPVQVITQSNNGNRFWTFSASRALIPTHCYWQDGDRDPANLHVTLGVVLGHTAHFHATWGAQGYIQHFQCTVDPNAPAGNAPALNVAVANHAHNRVGTAGQYANRILAYAREIAPQVFGVQYDQPSERERQAVKSKNLPWLKQPSGGGITKTSREQTRKRHGIYH